MTDRPVVFWEQPEKAPGLSVGGLLGGARRIYRGAFASFFALSLVQLVVQSILFVPSLIVLSNAFTKMLGVFGRVNYEPGMTQAEMLAVQQRMQAELQAAFAPEPNLLVATTIASSLSLVFTLAGFAVLTAVGLAVVEGGDRSIASAMGKVVRRTESLLLPALWIGLGLMLFSLPFSLMQPSILSGFGANQARIGALAAAVGLVLEIALIYFAVRWSLAIPAILSEGIGFRAGLSRSSVLTSGIKVRIFLAFLALAILSVLVEFVVLIVALVAGGVERSIVTGVITGLVGLALLVAIFIPMVPCLTVVAYRDRVEAARTSAAARSPEAIAPSI